jgi:phage terminase small subunit
MLGVVVYVKLTPKQKAFCQYYIQSGNATEAAIKAGYSKKTARVIGQENLLKPALKQYIAAQMKKMESKRIMDSQEALELLSTIARGEMVEEVLLSTPVGVKRMEKNADINQRLKALESLLKRYPLDQALEDAKLEKMQKEIELLHERINQLKGETEEEDNITSLAKMIQLSAEMVKKNES